MGRKREGLIWDEFEERDGGTKKCKHCGVEFKGKPSATRLRKHLSGVKDGGIRICTGVPDHVKNALADGSSKRSINNNEFENEGGCGEPEPAPELPDCLRVEPVGSISSSCQRPEPAPELPDGLLVGSAKDFIGFYSSSRQSPTPEVSLSLRYQDASKNFADLLYPTLTKAIVQGFQPHKELPRGKDRSTEINKNIEKFVIAAIACSCMGYSCFSCLGKAPVMSISYIVGLYHVDFEMLYCDPSHMQKGKVYIRLEARFNNKFCLEKDWVKAMRLPTCLSIWDLWNVANRRRPKVIQEIHEDVLHKFSSRNMNVAIQKKHKNAVADGFHKRLRIDHPGSSTNNGFENEGGNGEQMRELSLHRCQMLLEGSDDSSLDKGSDNSALRDKMVEIGEVFGNAPRIEPVASIDGVKSLPSTSAQRQNNDFQNDVQDGERMQEMVQRIDPECFEYETYDWGEFHRDGFIIRDGSFSKGTMEIIAATSTPASSLPILNTTITFGTASSSTSGTSGVMYTSQSVVPLDFPQVDQVAFISSEAPMHTGPVQDVITSNLRAFPPLVLNETCKKAPHSEKLNFHGYDVEARYLLPLEHFYIKEGCFWEQLGDYPELVVNCLDILGRVLERLMRPWTEFTREDLEMLVQSFKILDGSSFRLDSLKEARNSVATFLSKFDLWEKRRATLEKVQEVEQCLMEAERHVEELRRKLVDARKELDGFEREISLELCGSDLSGNAFSF